MLKSIVRKEMAKVFSINIRLQFLAYLQKCDVFDMISKMFKKTEAKENINSAK